MTAPRLVPGHHGQAILDALNAGHVIAVPLHGGYQAAALADRPDAVAALEAMADMPGDEQTPHFLVGHDSQAAVLVADWGTDAQRLADRCWPGPLTLVLTARGGAGSARFSMGTTRPLRRIIRAGGPLRAIALPGPGEPPLATAAEVVARFDGDSIALVADGGTHAGAGPTVVDCRLTPPRVLFEGALPEAFVDATLLMGTWRRRWFSR